MARPDRPKQFLPLLGRRSLFQAAYDRLRPLAARSGMLVVTGRRHAAWVHRQAPGLPRDQVIVEGVGRNTAASVALAALWIRKRLGDGIMVITPADHFIGPRGAFRATLARGIRAVRRTGALLTIGVPARTPETGFGYIRPGSRPVVPGVRPVNRFVEKPARRRAARMVRSGQYLWNTGIFVWKASSILEALRRDSTRIVGPLSAWVAHGHRGSWRVPATVLRRVPAAPIDRAVLERSADLLVTRASFRWSDLGTWSAIADLLRGDRRGNAGIGRMLVLDGSGCVCVNEGGLTVFVGVRDIVAVRDGSTILVCARDRAHRVRDVVADLRSRAGRRARKDGRA